MKHLSRIISLFALLFSFSTSVASAQGNAARNIQADFFFWHPSALLPFNNIGSAISILLPNVIVFAGVLMFLLIIYNGFQMLVLGGQFMLSPQRVTQAKNAFYYSILGFLLVVSAYFILQLISTVTGVNFTNPNIP